MGLLAYGELTIADINDGVSVVSVDVWYIQTSSPTEAPNKNDENWKTEAPNWTDGKYIWNKTVTTFDNGDTNESEPVCITGNSGAAGSGIVSITEEYYMSDSKTTAPNENDSGWTTTPPTWEDGKYIWTRSKIVWSNPTATTYTTPVCDSSWEAINDAKEDFDEQIKVINTTISSVSARVDAVEKEIELKVEYTDITSAIDEYDKTVSEGLRTRVSQIEIDVDGITSEVSDTQTLVEKVNSKVDNLQQTGVGWKVNYSDFNTTANGQLYLHGYDSGTGAAADVDGWVSWNGIQVIVPRATINPGNICPIDTPIYVVHRAAGITYLVWADSEGNWRYSNLSPASILGEWEWNHSTDIILGSFYNAGSGKAIESAQIYAVAASCDSVITSVETKSLIDQTSESILLQVEETYASTEDLEEAKKNVASLEITANEIKSEVSDIDGRMSATEQTVNSIESTVFDPETGESKIEQNAEAIKLKVSNEDMEAAIKESADNITLSVSERLSDSRDFMGVRYIRDWLNGRAKILNEPDEGVETVEIIDTESTESTETIVESDISNKWVECMVLVGEKDIAAGIIPTCYDENLQEIPIENLNPGVYTDEMLLDIYEEDTNVSDDVETVDVISDIETTEEETENANTTPIPLEEQYIELNGKHCLQIDLGSVHYDIDSISIWHYYVDGDHYNHLLEVSADGENWNVLFDSDLAGSYAETEDGRTYHFSNYAIDKTLSQLKIEQDNITLRVQDNATHFAELSVTTGGISSTVGNIQEKQSELSSAIDKSNADIKDVADDLKNNYTTINQTKEKIDFAVSNVDRKITAAVELTERGWKGKFAVLGMMGTNEDSEEDRKLQDETNTYIHMDGTGITVTGEIDQDQSEEDKNKVISTHMTRYGFFGRNMENKDVFWLDAQGCHTGRAYIDNGWETPGIKMIPIEYNKNGSLVNGVVYVKSGGAS